MRVWVYLFLIATLVLGAHSQAVRKVGELYGMVYDMYKNADYEPAKELLNELITSDQLPESAKAEAYSLMGVILSAEGQSEAGVQYALQAAHLNQDSPRYFYNAGIIALNTRMKDYAVAALRRAIQLSPDDLNIQTTFLVALTDRGLLTEARVLAEKLSSDPVAMEDARLTRAIASLYAREGDHDTAANFYQKTIDVSRAHDPHKALPSALTSLLETLVHLKRFDEAVIVAEDWMALPLSEEELQRSGTVFVLRADALVGLGRVDDAISELRVAVDKNWKLVDAHTMLAKLELQKPQPNMSAVVESLTMGCSVMNYRNRNPWEPLQYRYDALMSSLYAMHTLALDQVDVTLRRLEQGEELSPLYLLETGVMLDSLGKFDILMTKYSRASTLRRQMAAVFKELLLASSAGPKAVEDGLLADAWPAQTVAVAAASLHEVRPYGKREPSTTSGELGRLGPQYGPKNEGNGRWAGGAESRPLTLQSYQEVLIDRARCMNERIRVEMKPLGSVLIDTVEDEFKPRPGNDLVLGMVDGYGPQTIRVFVQSLREAGSDADIVLFLSTLTESALEVMRKYNARPFLFKKEEAQKHYFGAKSFRYQMYYDFLEIPEEYERYKNSRVFLSDTRDVYFQRDPFLIPREEGVEIELFMEDEDLHRIGTCPVNSGWIGDCWGYAFLNSEMFDKPISCSGTTLGTTDGIIRYSRAMVETMANAPSKNCLANDQRYHNYILHMGMLGNGVKMWPFASGPVSTVGTRPVPPRNGDGLILNAMGEVAHVIHQFDRHDQLIDHAEDWLFAPDAC